MVRTSHASAERDVENAAIISEFIMRWQNWAHLPMGEPQDVGTGLG
jgi:hypothetical protein